MSVRPPRFWCCGVDPGARARIEIPQGLLLTITNVCIVESRGLPGDPPVRVILHRDTQSVLIATFIPGEVQHAMVAIRTTGGVLENTGRCQVHISGFLEAEPESHDSDDRTDSDTSKSSSG